LTVSVLQTKFTNNHLAIILTVIDPAVSKTFASPQTLSKESLSSASYEVSAVSKPKVAFGSLQP
jgi:hypothetical protein